MVRSRAGGLVPRARAALLEAGLGVRGLAVITITPGDARARCGQIRRSRGCRHGTADEGGRYRGANHVGHELLAAVTGLEDAALAAALRPAVAVSVMAPTPTATPSGMT